MKHDQIRVFVFLLILIIAACLRFYHLLWGSPYFFNPDERNMATAVAQLSLPENAADFTSCIFSQLEFRNCNLNPHFFAYGHFPLYLAFFSGIVANWFFVLGVVTFPQAIFWLRFWSAVTSTLTVYVVYKIVNQLVGVGSPDSANGRRNLAPTIAALLAAFTPGLIQAAHMGTTESLLTFFFMVLIYLAISTLKTRSPQALLRRIAITAIVLGLALGTKLSAAVFVVPPFLALSLVFLQKTVNDNQRYEPQSKLWTQLSAASCGESTIQQTCPERSRRIQQRQKTLFVRVFTYAVAFLGLATFILLGSAAVALTTSPFAHFDWQDFINTSNYEINVARGLVAVFYTRQFTQTTPVLFQLEKIFPYALGWPLFIFGVLGLIGSGLTVIVGIIKKIYFLLIHNRQPTTDNRQLFVLIVSFCVYFLPNAYLFTKWTRFMTPVFPLFSIFAAVCLSQGFSVLSILYNKTQNSILRRAQDKKLKTQNNKLKAKSFNFLVVVLRFALCALTLLPGAAFMSIYTHEDVRFVASRWIYENIPSDTHVLSETANVIDIPIPSEENQPPPNYRLSPVSFDFYHLDESHDLQKDLIEQISNSEYIFIPSRRLFVNVMRLPHLFPVINRYYAALFSGTLGFDEVARFDSFPTLKIGGWKLEIDDEEAEETWSVFDHPVVRIYRKVKPMTREEYKDILDIEVEPK